MWVLRVTLYIVFQFSLVHSLPVVLVIAVDYYSYRLHGSESCGVKYFIISVHVPPIVTINFNAIVLDTS